MRVRIRVRLYGRQNGGGMPSSPVARTTTLEGRERAAAITALKVQMSLLAGQRRSNSEFRPWRVDIFYYLFAAVAGALVAWLAEVSSAGLSLRGVVIAGLCFGPLCVAPTAADGFRFWVGFRRPNRRLRRRIAVLQAEVERLQGSAK